MQRNPLLPGADQLAYKADPGWIACRWTLAARRLAAATSTVTLALLLACGGVGQARSLTTAETPSWACPSPTPLPYGSDGPVKEIHREPRPTEPPAGPVTYKETEVFYERWEQEYAALGGPPFPSPTPYALVGTTFTLGQRVRIPPLYALVSARPKVPQPDGRMLYFVDIVWTNPLGVEVPIDYASQVKITAITTAEGKTITGDEWGPDSESLLLIEGALPTIVPPGESSVVIPILAPAGEVQTAAITVVRDESYRPVIATTPDPSSPSSTPSVVATPTATTPTPNDQLRARPYEEVVVQFVNARPLDPPCGDAGATTPWGATGQDIVHGLPDLPVAAPPGAGRVVQLALQQVGKPYIWGATGPNAFDCSGLVVWAYSQIGMKVGERTSSKQFAGLRPVEPSQLQPGDLVYFAEPGAGVSHVGMLVGDLDGDGRWDWVHAASPRLGVRAEHNLFGSTYYGNPATCTLCIAGFRTLR